MARLPNQPTDRNWSRLGELILDYWLQKIPDIRSQNQGQIKALLQSYGVTVPDDVDVILHFDEEKKINISLPARPPEWGDEEIENLRTELEPYRRELGIVIMGGCRG